MNLLALHVGSSSVRAAILHNGVVRGRIVRAPFATRFDGVRVEVDPGSLVNAVARAVADLGAAVKRVDTVAIANMAPAWLAMDRRGKALTPIVTHQDRRSADEARELEQRFGKARHLKTAGNRPFPGGISSTTWAWHLKHAPGVMKKADLCGHVQTYLHMQLTGSRVVDPSNASFMGFYSTLDQSGWDEDLCANVGIKVHRLPQVMEAEAVGGLVTRAGGADFGLTHGTPVLVGCMDGSAALLLAGAKPGQLVNVCASTDVLALCTDRPRPHERLLTRAIGTGKRWVSVSTLAAAGSALKWAKDHLFPDLTDKQFYAIATNLAAARKAKPSRTKTPSAEPLLRFDPFLAGDRAAMDQPTASFVGLTLSTTRQDMLKAVIESLAAASAARLHLLREVNTVTFRKEVLVTDTLTGPLTDILRRDWPGTWRFREEPEATLRGIAGLAPSNVGR